MKDVMLDLETLGTGNNAVILQIGSCYFDRYSGEIGDKFCINIDIQSSLDSGFEVDGSTIKWWMSQSTDAQQSVICEPSFDVSIVMFNFNDFVRKARSIWSHATFDFVILMNYFTKLRIKPKFHYKSTKDLRTLTNLSGKTTERKQRVGIHHNALDDCIYQVSYASDCFNKLKGD